MTRSLIATILVVSFGINSFGDDHCAAQRRLLESLKEQSHIATQNATDLGRASITTVSTLPINFLGAIFAASALKLNSQSFVSVMAGEAILSVAEHVSLSMNSSQYQKIADLTNQTILQIEKNVRENTCTNVKTESPSIQSQLEQVGAALRQLNQATIELTDKIKIAGLENSNKIMITSAGAGLASIMASAFISSYKTASSVALVASIAAGINNIAGSTSAIRAELTVREAKAYLEVFRSATDSLLKHQQALNIIVKSRGILK